ncbi:MAG: helix-turn-helix transcriptional regulator [Alkalibacterium sp.]|nr:helix-turn-helix transcriptional regulator [Alkalibacterium sp.]
MDLSTNLISEVTDLFKALSEPNRLNIINKLYDSEWSVSDLARQLEMEQSSLSHQLKILKNARLVKVKKEGKKRLYSLADDHIYVLIEQVISHAKEKRN